MDQISHLPNTPAFNSFLERITCHEPTNESDYRLFALSPQAHMTSTGSPTLVQTKLWLPLRCGVNVEQALQTVCRALEATGHSSDSESALSLLALFVAFRECRNDPVAEFGILVRHIQRVSLEQILVFPDHAWEGCASTFSRFHLERFHVAQMAKRWRTAQVAELAQFNGRLSLRIDPVDVSVLILTRLYPQTCKADLRTHPAIHNYFGLVLSRQFTESLWGRLDKDQQLPVSLGASYVNPYSLMLTPGIWKLSYFVWSADKWDMLLLNPPVEDGHALASALANLKQRRSQLEADYGSLEIKQSILDHNLDLFSAFISRAALLRAECRRDEALMHLVIAMDTLLGSEKAISEAVSERAAVLVHRQLGRTYPEMKALVKQIYAARSKYVHDGESEGYELMEAAQSVCHELVKCLLRLRRIPANHEHQFTGRWFKEIAYIAKAIEAGKTVPNAEYVAVGSEL